MRKNKRPASTTLILDQLSDTGVKGDGYTTYETPSFSGTTTPGLFVNISVDGEAVGRVQTDVKTGTWLYKSPRLPVGMHEVTAVAENSSGKQSFATNLSLYVLPADTNKSNGSLLPHWTAVQNASSGTLTGSDSNNLKLTLNNVGSHINHYSDQESRFNPTVSNANFFASWPSVFANDPPIATLSYREGSNTKPQNISLKISDPTYNQASGTVTYKASLSDFKPNALQGVPQSFGMSSIFIENPRYYPCDPRQAFDFKPNKYGYTGIINALVFESNSNPLPLRDDITGVTDPVHPKIQLSVVGLLNEFYFAGGRDGRLTFNFLVSAENQVEVQSLLDFGLSDTQIQLNFAIYDKDVITGVWFPTFYTDPKGISAIIGQRGNALDLETSVVPDPEIYQHPLYSVVLGVDPPPGTIQILHRYTTPTNGYDFLWGTTSL